jgi:hypothetical protein
MVKSNLVRAYILLVGLPLLFLILTLRAGKGLSSPPSLGGDWAVELTGGTEAGLCLGSFTSMSRPVLTFYQMGPELSLLANDASKTTFHGEVHGREISAVAAAKTGSGTCPGSLWHIQGALADNGASRSLQGRFWWEGCTSCGPVQFRATKAGLPRK